LIYFHPSKRVEFNTQTWISVGVDNFAIQKKASNRLFSLPTEALAQVRAKKRVAR
jgi:hypothetical protein